jgi:hypothetical protein
MLRRGELDRGRCSHRSPRPPIRWCAAAALTLALFLVAVAGAQASITVANTNDSGAGSLRQAISDAASGETIVVPPGTYTLTSGELAIAKSVTISGDGAADTTVRAGGAFRVFHTSGAGNAITISAITISDGHPLEPAGDVEGGGVWNLDAAVTLSEVIVTNNHADTDGAAGQGGGLAAGGGVANDSGTLTLLRSQVTGNTASALGASGTGGNTNGLPGGIVRGGGLMDTGTLTVTDTTFAENAAIATGGQGAPSKNGGPGGITFAGGAFIETALPTSVSSSTFTGNVADTSGGSPGSGGAAGPGGISQGGGLFVTAIKTAIALTNLTVTASVAHSSSTGIAQGGGLYANSAGSGSEVSLTNDTLASNTASGPAEAIGGNLNAGVGVQSGNTIFSEGVAMAGKENCSSPGTSLGHNLEDTTPSQCGLSTALGDQIGVDPLLGPLQDNGGPTQTMALLIGSPAIDAGESSDCPATDQRGLARPQGAACDIGAYEVAPGAASTAAASAIGTTSATLDGSATNPDLVAGTVFFQYGPTTSYGLSTAAQPVAPGTFAGAFAASIAGLTPAATYHFRAVASNAAGTAFGADQTFVTATALTPLPPPIAPAPQAPQLGAISVNPHNLLPETGSGASVARRSRRLRGATISYTDSETGLTTFTVMRPSKGFRSGRSCLAKRPRPQKGKPRRCTRYIRLGSFTHSDTAGANHFHFTGRVNRRPLRVGPYRLEAIARNAAGQPSRPRTVTFQIIR